MFAFVCVLNFFLLFLEVYWHRKLAESWYWCNCINLDSTEAVKIVSIDMYIHKQINTKWLIYNTCIDVKVIFPGVCEQISGGDWQLILSKYCLHRSIQCVEEWKRKNVSGERPQSSFYLSKTFSFLWSCCFWFPGIQIPNKLYCFGTVRCLSLHNHIYAYLFYYI